MMNLTPVVKQLLILNIIFFIGSQIVPISYDLFSLYYPENDKFQYWQLLTHVFMHAKMPNLMHIVFNMMGLVMFGSPLEHFWGGKKFLFFYISCGLGAALIQLGVTYYEVHTILDSLSELKLTTGEIHSLLNMNLFQKHILKAPIFLLIMALWKKLQTFMLFLQNLDGVM